MKKIILILSIISIALTGNAQLQMWLGWQTGGEGSDTLLLDQYNAIAAYSLIDVSTPFLNSDVIRIRRSSDNSQ